MKRRPQSVSKQRFGKYLGRCVPLCGLILSLLVLVAPAAAQTPAYLGERLNYTISYSGIFSAMKQIDIADAVLQTEQGDFDGQPVYHSRLQVSTEAYGKMERFYPLRYRFESYFSMDLKRTLLFDEQKKTSKEQREIVWVDWKQGAAKRYKRRAPANTADSETVVGDYDFNVAEAPVKKKSTKRPDQLPPLLSELRGDTEEFRKAKGADLHRMSAILDQLSLLQTVRTKELVAGQEIRLPVLDGHDVLNYRIQVVKRESIERQGRVWDTYKLRFDGYKQEAGTGEADHPPMFVWLTTDERRIPVRFASDYALGQFAGELKVDEGLAALVHQKRIASLP